MKTIIEILTDSVSDAFEKCGYDKSLGLVTASDRLDLCQFQCNGALTGAKLYKKPPFVIAEEVVKNISNDDIFKTVEVVKPGFINITLTDNFVVKTAIEIANDQNLGIPQADKAETIILDYGGPNVAKPLHIGHLRPAIIGESLKRIARATGRKVIGDVHLGDWGLPIGLIIAELEVRNPDWKCFSDDFNPETDKVETIDVDDLNEIYPFASQKSKEDEAFRERAKRITFELQNGNVRYIALWKEIIRSSVEDLKKSYEKLNVDFDLWYGESDADRYMDELLNVLSDKGILYESQGAMVVDVTEETDKATIPPIIIVKTDKAFTYETTDLATIIQRQQDFKPDKIWYVVDKRQGLRFTQLFRCAKKAGLVPEATELDHVDNGTMNGSDGKPFKTREGGVMRLSDFLQTVIDAAQQKMNESPNVSEKDHKETAQKIGIAAIKFGDLINHRSKDYIFDMDKFLSFEGKTGTYLLYTVTRINSILRKLGREDSTADITGIYTDIERQLLLHIIQSGDAFRHAIEEKAPNFVCENAYKMAALFSTFYHDNHIANEKDETKKSSWIALCLLTRKLLLKHLDVLGIEPVESM